MKHPAFHTWFDATGYENAFNETFAYYYSGDRSVHGVVDRLVVTADSCFHIDYKTHRNATVERLEFLAAPYHEQLRLYREGIKRLWQDKIVRDFLLFTACVSVYEWRDKAQVRV